MRKSSLIWIPVALLAVSAMFEGSMHARAARQKNAMKVASATAARCRGARELEVDLDGDGRPELVQLTRVGDDAWADVYVAGELRSSSRIGAWHEDASLQAVDVDGDGKLDLVQRWSDDGEERAQVWLSDGGAAFVEGWSAVNPALCLAQR